MEDPPAPQEKPVVAPEDRVPYRQKLAYGSSGVVDILSVWVLVSVAYNVFNMELKLRPMQVAVILMALRLWDGVADPVMGWISDNTRTRWGRRRPYMLVGAICAGLTYPLIWWFPRSLEGGQIVAWVIGFGILFYTCFTVWAMPYQSLLMEMTPDYNERTRVAAVRGVFQTIAGLLVGCSLWLSYRSVFHVDGVPGWSNGMRWISLGIGAIILLVGPLPAFFVKERYYTSDVVQKQGKVSLLKGLRETLTCRPFLILCGFTILFLIGTSIYDSYGRYVGTYYVLGGDWGEASNYTMWGTFIYTGFSLMMIPLYRRLSERIGKIRVLFIAMGLVLVSGISTWWTNTPAIPPLMLLNTAFIGMGYAGLWLMIPSMQVDVVDHDELATGERREGSFASIFSWVLKLSFCFGYLISGPLLEWTGFDAALEGPQPDAVLTNMRIGYIAIPVTALLLAIFLLKFFPITKTRAAEIRAALEARRGKV